MADGGAWAPSARYYELQIFRGFDSRDEAFIIVRINLDRKS
jgi:hypothetical protein